MRYCCYSLALLLVSCTKIIDPKLSYVTVQDLASTYVGSPDPLQSYYQGAQITVVWRLPAQDFLKGHTILHMDIIYGTMQTQRITIHLPTRKGSTIYRLLDQEYIDKQGIVAYKLSIVTHQRLVATWQHNSWANVIYFESEKDEK